MKNDLLDRIKASLPSFSKGQRAIGNYILTNYDKAAFMTASRLGEVTGVSESTVVRFATVLGFDGYPELQTALQELIRIKSPAGDPVQTAEGDVYPFGQGVQDAFAYMLSKA
jgi:DNA-binding MurR/RpiR family transcriptional regulator